MKHFNSSECDGKDCIVSKLWHTKTGKKKHKKNRGILEYFKICVNKAPIYLSCKHDNGVSF